MNKLLSAHFSRLKKNKCFWICTLLMIFMAVFRNIDSYLMVKKYHATISLEDPFFTYVMLSAILLPVFCSLFLGTEFSDGTIRNKLIIGHSRSSIYLSNLVLCTAAGLLIALAYMLFSLCTGVPLLGFFDPAIPQSVIFISIGCSIVLTLANAAIYTFVAMLNQNKAVTSVICILSAFLLLMVGTYIHARLLEPEMWESYAYVSENGEVLIQEEASPNPYYVDGIKRDAYEFLNDFLPGGQAYALTYLPAAHPGRMALYSGLITIVFTGFGIYYFQRKDIK
ncbi:MAG: ABC transporter permease [Lachnospiraceae bacterium]|nr:ABC transporter permease [Lachnospiraceae bacterium]MDE6186203.1 ABC transporter permease [Lachnospiraceae bacterium]